MCHPVLMIDKEWPNLRFMKSNLTEEDSNCILHDWWQNVRVENLPVFVESHHGRHVLQRGRGRRGDLVVRHRRPGQSDI